MQKMRRNSRNVVSRFLNLGNGHINLPCVCVYRYSIKRISNVLKESIKRKCITLL